MDTQTLKKLQKIQLGIALDIKKICEKHNIDYFLDSGTLLGAVRHKGFIPWDDDIDLGMTRENYDKFLSVAQCELGDKYFVQNWNTDKNFGKPFTKICLNDTKYVERDVANLNIHHGIFVDILPYDKAPRTEYKINNLRKRLEIIRLLILIKCGYYDQKSYLFKIFKLLLNIVPKSLLIQMYNKQAQNKRIKTFKEYYAHTGTAKLCSWRMPKEVLENLINISFDDELFLAPLKWDDYLKKAYGDYMKLPDESKRCCGHNLIELKF